MKVKILRVADEKLVDAEINEGENYKLPSRADGWKFDISNQLNLKNTYVYVLVRDEDPAIIEGYLVYKLNNQEPYMAYLEVAPHNKGNKKVYDLVAGCLLAYAARLSSLNGKDSFRGWLAFTVQEDNLEDQNKLMALYSKRYYAKKVTRTEMVISPTDGEKLVEKYLGS